MITWMTITLLFLVMVGLIIVATSLSSSSEKERRYRLLLSVFAGITFAVLWCNIMSLYEPKPIDVYRGYTELKITSVNGVPTDTVVVWKKINNYGN